MKGTKRELEIIKPTTIGSFPPTKFTTKGEPNPVDIPASKNTDSFILSEIGIKAVICIKVIITYSPTGITISLKTVRTISFVGFVNTL